MFLVLYTLYTLYYSTKISFCQVISNLSPIILLLSFSYPQVIHSFSLEYISLQLYKHIGYFLGFLGKLEES